MINNKKFRFFSLFFLTFLAYTPGLTALELRLSAKITSGWVLAEAKTGTLDTGMILSSLEEGLTAEIIFEFRVYKINRGFFAFLGDRLIIEKKMSYIAFKDFFLNQYVIQAGDEKFNYFETIDAFIESYSTISDCYLIEAGKINPYDYYILARVTSYPVKLDPPLHIITLFSSIGRTSPWVDYRFSVREEGEG